MRSKAKLCIFISPLHLPVSAFDSIVATWLSLCL
jgi:hypothetical protein